MQLHGEDNTQLWERRMYQEELCMQNCTADPECSKYLYQNQQSADAKIDCWIWPYNRTNHVCDEVDLGYVLGVVRPVGNATCAGYCNLSKPLKLDRGVCYCDLNCTAYLDCCPDYANHCTPRGVYSCKEQCWRAVHNAVHGEGYCWCLDGFSLVETDNNSYGSCCNEYYCSFSIIW